ncbi:E3 ubiquitin-protein ligase MPSR1-like [Wolffia australiana]
MPENASVGVENRPWLVFFPVMVGVMRVSSENGDRLVMISSPVPQSPLIIHRGGEESISDLAAAMREILSTDSAPAGPPPASKSSIEALRSVDRPEIGDGDGECAVCLDALWDCEDGEVRVVKEMPCGHRFHGGCVEKWLNSHGVCPLCRFRMPVEEEGTKKEEEQSRRLDFNIRFDFGGFLRHHHHHHPIIDDLD